MKFSPRVLWAIMLIFGGLIAFLQIQQRVVQVAPEIWIGFFVVITVLGLIGYYHSDWKDWNWLFPVGIAIGLAVSLVFAFNRVNKPYVAAPLFAGLLIPFGAVYWSDRTRHWWALIPGGVMLFLTVMSLVVDSNGGPWLGGLALFMVALIFLAVYLTGTKRVWALLVAYILAVLGIAPFMIVQGQGAEWGASYYGAVLFFAVALPFFAVYLRNPARWWAIIPAGALATLGIVAALAISGVIRPQSEGGNVLALLLVGTAATFAIPGWRHAKNWAKIVALVLVLSASASIFFFGQMQIIGALTLFVLGAFLLVSALRRKPV